MAFEAGPGNRAIGTDPRLAARKTDLNQATNARFACVEPLAAADSPLASIGRNGGLSPSVLTGPEPGNAPQRIARPVFV
jgi:hypothetical protein